jgi:hypothetical protein
VRLLPAALFVLAASGCATAPMRMSVLPPPGVYTFADTLTLGEADGVRIGEGGLSGLDVLADGLLVGVTDRGPNVDAEALAGRPAKRFPVPGYRPSVVEMAVAGDALVVTGRVHVLAPDGTGASGRPPPGAGGALVETALGPDGEALEPDPWGLDAEGLADAGDGTVWVAEEYRPSLWRVDRASGLVLERFLPVPETTADRPLPGVLALRGANLGFEGVAVVPTADGPRLVAALQGPLRPPGADAATPVARLVRVDPATGRTETLAYALDGPARKVGDLAALPDGRLLLLEHGPAEDGAWGAAVYVLDLPAARAVDDAGPLPESFGTAVAARAGGVALVPRALVLDLVAAGWPAGALKPEGLAVDGRRLAVLADNDYGLDSPESDGRAVATGRRTFLWTVDLPAEP